MHTKTTVFFTSAIVQSVLAFPYPFVNTTTATNLTICNSSINFCEKSNNISVGPSPITPGENVCVEIYPSDLSVVNSRYPDYDTDHLHQARQFFMLRRQFGTEGEVATRVDFEGLPANTTNITCRLEFILPRVDLQVINGPNPSFDVYQVPGDLNTIVTWNTFENTGMDLFGTVNGEARALNKTRIIGRGVAAINETACNETLSFQMGMKYDSEDPPNYWDFVNYSPPAWPMQGFRIVYGC